jgi:hypothetical protein
MQRMWVTAQGEDGDGRTFGESEGIEDNFTTRDCKQKIRPSVQLYLIGYGVSSLWFQYAGSI